MQYQKNFTTFILVAVIISASCPVEGSDNDCANIGVVVKGGFLLSPKGEKFLRTSYIPNGTVVCIEGDGSLMVNIQALQTIKDYKLPIKIFVLCNNVYNSIRNTQTKYFGRLNGCDPSSGLSIPNIQHLAWTYGVELNEIHISPDTQIKPRLQSRMVDGKVLPGRLEDIE